MSENRKRALISVSDKNGVVEFARSLVQQGWEILSTGGTARVLEEAGLPVTGVAEVTGFPEILDGRVKTLHPHIHGAILARPDSAVHRRQLEEQGINPIGIVAVNLYPFSRTVSRARVTPEEAVEQIDIGGPAMVRAAAKNHAFVTVVVSPSRYPGIIAELEREGEISLQTRLRLAVEAFAHTARYDALIAAYLQSLPDLAAGAFFPPLLVSAYAKVEELRYGENPQQQAAFYVPAAGRHGIGAARQLHGKALSFNNINDLEAAWALVREFNRPAVVALKHANPCGVGIAATVEEAYDRAYRADPVSIFGGIVAANRPVDGATARAMTGIFLEVVAAPAFTAEAREILSRKKDIRLLEMAAVAESEGGAVLEWKQVSGGLLVQTVDREPVDLDAAKEVTVRRPTVQERQALTFAQTVVKHVKSNAIVVASEEQTLGIGAGQMSRIAAARLALAQAGAKARGAVLGSDAYFPFPDVVEEAAAAGISAIVQPGGSLNDGKSIAACDRFGLAMLFTGRRYFKH